MEKFALVRVGGGSLFWLGCLAFVFFFLHDWNDLTWGKKWGSASFGVGCILLGVSVGVQIARESSTFAIFWRIVAGAAALVFIGLLIWSVTFALRPSCPFSQPGDKRSLCRNGMYALCRHPGVLWLGLALLCLCPASGLPFRCFVTYTVLDALLVWFEDAVVFPKVLTGYKEYRADVPFLIPNFVSISAVFHN